MEARSCEDIVNETWQKVQKTHRNQLRDWVKCFIPANAEYDSSHEIIQNNGSVSFELRDGSDPCLALQNDRPNSDHDERNEEIATAEEKAKLEIFNTLSIESNQNNAQVNFILRLIRDDKYAYFHFKKNGRMRHVPKVQLALAFLRAMTQLPECKNFINVTLELIQISNQSDTNSGNQSRGNAGIHKLVKCGFCTEFESYYSVATKNNVDETLLHLAAEVGNKHDVKLLLEKGALLERDNEGCTPLHSAAMAAHPDHEIAEMLVDVAKRGDYHLLLNCGTANDENTALHLAAGNVNITQEFISQLKDADPQIQNAAMDTPFHVAAKSSNPKAIVYMLNAFSPARNGWDVDDVERDRDPEHHKSLLTICATSGNAEAVALLIQNGADISKGVLHEIVIESVKSGQNTDKLLEVYRSIVDNAVTWKCLEQNRRAYTKGTQGYKDCLRETMMSLITMRMTIRDRANEVDVLRLAIDCGASQMFQEILNTEDVFRKSIDDKCAMFDITNFTEATTSCNKSGERKPYLQYLLLNYDTWDGTNIFSSEPIATLIEPYISRGKISCSVVGLLQLILLIFLCVFYVPHSCFFNISNHILSNTPAHHDCLWHSKHEIAGLPFVLLQGTSVLFVVVMAHSAVFYMLADCYQLFYNIRFRLTKHGFSVWLTKILIFLWRRVPHAAFYVSVFSFWVQESRPSDQWMSMTLLFGWISTLLSFSAIWKEFSVFTLLLDEVIVIDVIQRVLPLFGFTLVAFAFALHVLRVAVFRSEQQYNIYVTIYDVFAATFGMGGELLENARDGVPSLFAAVFTAYMVFTAVILLTVLIAMITNRYELAKRRAEDFWRYRMVRAGMSIDQNLFFIPISNILRKIYTPSGLRKCDKQMSCAKVKVFWMKVDLNVYRA